MFFDFVCDVCTVWWNGMCWLLAASHNSTLRLSTDKRLQRQERLMQTKWRQCDRKIAVHRCQCELSDADNQQNVLQKCTKAQLVCCLILHNCSSADENVIKPNIFTSAFRPSTGRFTQWMFIVSDKWIVPLVKLITNRLVGSDALAKKAN